MSELRRLPAEKQVDCDCHAGLQLPVLIESTGTYESITACVGCGKLEYVACLMEELPHNVMRCVGNEVLAIDPPLRQWLEQWPRRAGRRRMSESKYTFFPATLRCGNSMALADLAEQAYVEQEGMSYRERLVKAGFPAGPPPVELPKAMESFLRIWKGATLSLEAEMSAVFDLSYDGYEASPFWGTNLFDREDIHTEVFRRLDSDKPAERELGYQHLQTFHLAGPEVLQLLERHLKRLSVEVVPGFAWNLRDGEWIEQLCSVALSLSPESACLVPAMRELAKRIGSKDDSVRRHILELAGLLKRLERK